MKRGIKNFLISKNNFKREITEELFYCRVGINKLENINLLCF